MQSLEGGGGGAGAPRWDRRGWPWAGRPIPGAEQREQSPLKRQAGSTQAGPPGSRALKKPQPRPAWPGAGVPESWAMGSLTRGSTSHPRSGSSGPGVGGRTLKALTRGLRLEGRSQRPGVLAECQGLGAGGRVRNVAGTSWLCRLGPHLPVGKALLQAGWKRWLTQDPPPSSARPAERGSQSWKQERKLVLRALLVMGAHPCFPEQLGLVVGCQGAQRARLGEPGPEKTLPEDRGGLGWGPGSGPSKAPGCGEWQVDRSREACRMRWSERLDRPHPPRHRLSGQQTDINTLVWFFFLVKL